MDFLIMLGLNALFDLLWPQYKQRSQGNTNVEAAFWFGTSYENLHDENYDKEPTQNSDYDYVDW
jgi:hypothetical protein